MRRVSVALAATLALVAAPLSAHIVFAETNAAAGSYYVGFLRVGHGCDGSATVSVRVEIPASIITARPQPKPGWTLTIEHQPLAKAVTGEGGAMITQRVSAVTWTGRLDAEQFDQFALMMKLPDQAGDLYFPTTQRCEAGQNDWTMIPAMGQPWHSVPRPAPVLHVMPAAGDAGMGSMHH